MNLFALVVYLGALFVAFLRPRIIETMPAGIVPDNMGMGGVYGMWANANAYAAAMASYATGTAPTILAADLAKGVIQLNTGASGGFNVTLPTTSQILDALGRATIPTDGSFFKPLMFVNNAIGQTGTLVAGDAMTTISGTATIATSVTRNYMLRVLGSTVQFTNVGALTL